LKKENHKVALVTGAARRIGKAMAIALHEAGYDVIIHCLSSLNEAESLCQAMNTTRPDSALVLTADLAMKGEVLSLIDKAYVWKKRLDLLVNNASTFGKTSTANAFDETHWDFLFKINAQAPFWLSQKAYPHLAVQKGAIINITDIHAKRPLKNYAVYCQSKAALAMQTKVLAREFAPLVRVNAIAPGAIAWPEGENAISEKIQQNILEETPLKCHGEPQFIAKAMLALVDNNFITGQLLTVDGGRELV
jgi:pteridine reductase